MVMSFIDTIGLATIRSLILGYDAPDPTYEFIVVQVDRGTAVLTAVEPASLLVQFPSYSSMTELVIESSVKTTLVKVE